MARRSDAKQQPQQQQPPVAVEDDPADEDDDGAGAGGGGGGGAGGGADDDGDVELAQAGGAPAAAAAAAAAADDDDGDGDGDEGDDDDGAGGGGGGGGDDDDEPDTASAAGSEDIDMGGDADGDGDDTRPASRAGGRPGSAGLGLGSTTASMESSHAAALGLTDPKPDAKEATAAGAGFLALSPSLFAGAGAWGSAAASAVGASAGGISAGHPSHLAISHFPYLSKIANDKLTVHYGGKGNHAIDVGTVRANVPVPAHYPIYYFEVAILELSPRPGRPDANPPSTPAIGFAPESFVLNRHVGHTNDSYAYGDGREHGRKFNGLARGDKFGLPLLPGGTVTPAATQAAGGEGKAALVVVGAGINWYTREIFFTRNGKPLGVAFTGVTPVPLYPCVSLHCAGEKVRVNFGQQKFLFPIDAMRADEKDKFDRAVRAGMVPNDAAASPLLAAPGAAAPAAAVDKRVVTPLIRAFLLHHGYEQSLHALDAYFNPALAAAAAAKQQAAAANAADGKHSGKAAASNGHAHKGGASAAAAAGASNGHSSHANGSASNGANSVASAGAGDAAYASLAARKRIRESIVAGDIGGAIARIEALCGPALLSAAAPPSAPAAASSAAAFSAAASSAAASSAAARASSAGSRRDAAFHVQCLRFLELLTHAKTDEAIRFAREVLTPFNDPAHQAVLHSVLSALAYADLERSPVSALLQPTHRQAVADRINTALLDALSTGSPAPTPSASPVPASASASASSAGAAAAAATSAGGGGGAAPYSVLERLLRHAACTSLVIDRETHGMVPPFDV